MPIFQISPYAAKAIVTHFWTGTLVLLYATFRFSMNVDNTPANALWNVELDGVGKPVINQLWQDAWTLRLVVIHSAGLPGLVTLEYLGPDVNLATTWNKQWEPWGDIVSILLPVVGLSATYTFGGGATGDIATMTFTGGVLTAVTLVP